VIAVQQQSEDKGMSSPDPNLRVYNSPEVAAHYANLDYLSACERMLFNEFLAPGQTILDLGVGGGRTTTALSAIAGRYIGVDYAPEMVALCRKKFPDLEFHVGEAGDLSAFGNMSFDAVVMAFNGMDYASPDKSRFRSLTEIGRILKPGGVLIFSSHNPRVLFPRITWRSTRIDDLAGRLTRSVPFLSPFVALALRCGRFVLLLARSGIRCFKQFAQVLPTRTFWRGEGYLLDSAHGGLITHYAIPAKVVAETEKFGFQSVEVQGDDYPHRSSLYVTEWYYYVFVKLDVPTRPAFCA
jgi:SAM-dependent methyltransferase